MSFLTITIRLSADEKTRSYLCKLSLKHTLLINALHEQVQQHESFDIWQQQRNISCKELELLSKAAISRLQFTELPGRFLTSAIASVRQTCKSWFALQKRRCNKLMGKQRWLQVQERDLELGQTTDFSTNQIHTRAQEVLAQINDQIENASASKQQSKCQKDGSRRKGKNKNVAEEQTMSDIHHAQMDALFKLAFKLAGDSTELLTFRSIAYLLRHDLTVSDEEEKPEDLLQQLDSKRIEIARLEAQLQSRLPKCRDLTGEIAASYVDAALAPPNCLNSWRLLQLSLLLWAGKQVVEPDLRFNAYLIQQLQQPDLSGEMLQAEFKAWQQAEPERMALLARIPNSLPQPILFLSSDDLY